VKVLVTGAGGQLGRALARAGALGPPHGALDITDAAAVLRALDEVRPDVVVNAAAYTAVDRAEAERDAAFAVNRGGAQAVASACAARDVRLVHVSTDYVFDGEKRGPYVETDAIAPINGYGASKAAGEAAVLLALPGAIVVRTSWLFSADGANFVTTMIRLARQRPSLRVVADQEGCPTSAADLARGILELAKLGVPGGIYHFAGAPATTWHALATATIDEAARLGRAPRVPIEAIATADYPTPARRPRSSVLDTAKVRALGVTPAPWLEGVRAVVTEFA